MAQIFHRSTNFISRFSVFASAFLAGLALTGVLLAARSPILTNQNVTRDQPIQFSHKHHVGDDGIDCRYCHTGVEFSAIGIITAIVFLSLLIGKTAGVVGLAWLAKAIGFPLPAGVGARELVIAGIISGIGLTVALFVAGEAFPERAAQDSAKMGALASALIAPLALVLARLLKVKPAQPLKAKELVLP